MRLTLGRRLESMPTALFALLLLTAAVVVVAAVVGTVDHVASDGTRCGGVFTPNRPESHAYAQARCEELLADARVVAFPLAGLAVLVVVVLMVTLVVRGWHRTEPAPWPGA